MTPQQIEALIEQKLTSFEAEMPAASSTTGAPWPEAKVRSYIAKLKDALVTPYMQLFELSDLFVQTTKSPPDEADYWVVAETSYCLEFYDPLTNEFGLADRGAGDALPKTIGVRGDLVGVFCAI